MALITSSFTVGAKYTRAHIHETIGGGERQSYLASVGGRISIGFFRFDLNPDAPTEIQVGFGPRREQQALKLFRQSDKSLLVFTKSDEKYEKVNIWTYHGVFLCTSLIRDPQIIRVAEQKSGRNGAVWGLLQLERHETE